MLPAYSIEAEEFAEDDKRRKARVELRNQADSIVYQTRRTIEEAEDKLSEEDSAPVLAKVDELEALIRTDDAPIPDDDLDEAAIQSKVKELEESMHSISAKLYEAAAAAMENEQQESSVPEEDGVVDASFEVVDDED